MSAKRTAAQVVAEIRDQTTLRFATGAGSESLQPTTSFDAAPPKETFT